MSKTILVVAAHTDDEVLGCGGTIARHVDEGDTVYNIFLADGVSSRQGTNMDDATKRNDSAEEAKRILGVKENFYLDFKDNQLDAYPLLEIIRPLERIVNRLRPSVIYTHHHGDLNIDHRITHQAVMTACRPVPGMSVREIYAFEVMSSTEWANPCSEPFLPNHYVDITKYLSSKLSAINSYAVEMRNAPHSRNIEHIEHLATHRGHSVGIAAAEAFVTLRTLK